LKEKKTVDEAFEGTDEIEVEDPEERVHTNYRSSMKRSSPSPTQRRSKRLSSKS
jgi:hypothetical protein